MAPCSLARTGFHFRFGSTLKFFSRLNALPFVLQFHPKNVAKTLLAFSSSGHFWLPWFPSPFWGWFPYKVLLQPALTSSLKKASPLEVFAF